VSVLPLGRVRIRYLPLVVAESSRPGVHGRAQIAREVPQPFARQIRLSREPETAK
jgi:hypothetical protein